MFHTRCSCNVFTWSVWTSEWVTK